MFFIGRVRALSRGNISLEKTIDPSYFSLCRSTKFFNVELFIDRFLISFSFYFPRRIFINFPPDLGLRQRPVQSCVHRFLWKPLSFRVIRANESTAPWGNSSFGFRVMQPCNGPRCWCYPLCAHCIVNKKLLSTSLPSFFFLFFSFFSRSLTTILVTPLRSLKSPYVAQSTNFPRRVENFSLFVFRKPCFESLLRISWMVRHKFDNFLINLYLHPRIKRTSRRISQKKWNLMLSKYRILIVRFS